MLSGIKTRPQSTLARNWDDPSTRQTGDELHAARHKRRRARVNGGVTREPPRPSAIGDGSSERA